MTNTTYNGWTNYETWLTNLWFDEFNFEDYVNDGTFDDMDKDDVLIWVTDYIKDFIDEFIESMTPNGTHGFIKDMINSAIQEIDYRDIAEHYVDDIMDELNDKE